MLGRRDLRGLRGFEDDKKKKKGVVEEGFHRVRAPVDLGRRNVEAVLRCLRHN